MAFKARHLQTRKIIKVYKHIQRETYVNADDCTTEYKEKEIQKL